MAPAGLRGFFPGCLADLNTVRSVLDPLAVLADVGGAQLLATGKSPETEIDFKYAIIGTAVGVAISAGFLALKICMIRRNLFDNDSSDLRNTPPGLSDTVLLKKRAPRLDLNSSKRDAQVIEL
ncbi:PREDICTED: putative uncharacterized protein C10orf128 homolog [Galeopterus variegatus]|uniref:Transmembrane protein 273 n=1 Tax=Galeopterus variegatus TaxID=482537 RepID=A0ABM0R0X4_GALVR|nr:PREDICTED: putative uncharacterized protein C10orf128 homolog [Galeopterus variegatus]